MFKKILSLALCLVMCLSIALTATSCGEASTTTATGDVPATFTLLGITGETTTQEYVDMVEKAINDILAPRYKSKIELMLVTEDEYLDLVEEQLELAEYYKTFDAAVATYNTYVKKQSTSSYNTEKIIGNWIKPRVEISLDTLATRLLYVAEQTTVHEDGKVETLYPEPRSPIDIITIANEDMYDLFASMGLLKPIEATYTSYQNLQKYIYPTYFTQLKELKGNVSAIPNNNMLAEYTYLLVDKDLADKYDYNINTFTGFADLSDFLAKVKANETVVPFAEEPDALGVFYTFSEDVAVGTYFDPINGFNAEDPASGFEIQNLFEVEEYVAHLGLMEEYTASGYFSGNADNGYAVKVVKGDASLAEIYAAEDSKYDIKVIQNPFVLREAIFDGMLAVTSYSSDNERALEIVEAINTDSAVKNLLQYGIEGVNYELNDNGTVHRLNDGYMMDNALTGNVYMGHLEEGMDETEWLYVQRTNLKSALSPSLIYPVDDAYIESNLAKILHRTALSEALAEIGLTFDQYDSATGSMANTYGDTLKKHYKAYFLEMLIKESYATEEKVEAVFASSTPAYSWYEDKIAEKIVNEKYSTICTTSEVNLLIETKMCSPADLYKAYTAARDKAAPYYTNIENLRVVARLTIFADLTDEEYETKYNSLGAQDFEKAVYEYLKGTYVEENELSEEEYEELVKSFIMSALIFFDENNQQVTYSWEDFEQIKEDADKFAEPMDKVRAAYNDRLIANGFTQEQVDALNDIQLGQEVIGVIRAEYYRSQNHTSASFKNAVNNKILQPFGIDYNTFKSLQNKDNASYTNYLKQIKSYYKDQLLSTMTKSEYNALTLPKVMDAVFEYYLESYTKAYSQMCDVAGISYNEYVEYSEFMNKYIKCTNQMKNTFLYTLQEMYSSEVVNSLTPEMIEQYVYEAVYTSGYYMNQVASTLGVTLSDYNYAKSNAKKYTEYLNTLVEYYKNDITSAGYNVDDVKKMTPADIEELLCDIVEKKHFADYKSIEEIAAELSASYIEGLKTTNDVVAYCQASAKALSENTLFETLVNYLNENLQKELSTLKAN